jgi:hypothetical protein
LISECGGGPKVETC